ncbi:hypothetical protein GCM10009113_01250 [Marinobacter szutsaonensis]
MAIYIKLTSPTIQSARNRDIIKVAIAKFKVCETGKLTSPIETTCYSVVFTPINIKITQIINSCFTDMEKDFEMIWS